MEATRNARFENNPEDPHPADGQFGREIPHGLHRRGEVAFEAGEFEVGGVVLVSHGRIIREGVVGVKRGNHLWIRITVQICLQKPLVAV